MKSTVMPSIACLGGGTGLSTMLRGLKKYSENITAIVAVTDDGGGSGVLRRELGILPPGDIRNCIQALADDENLMTRLLNYRFRDGSLAGQSFGNLLLAAMNGISDSFDEAAARVGEALAITGRVLPVTNDNVALLAELEDGSTVLGESHIQEVKERRCCRIKRVALNPRHARALDQCITALEEADLIVMGPGSLYTSVIPNLLVDGVPEVIERSRVVKLYVCNIMTQPGETEGYTISDHINAIFAHAGRRVFDRCIVNSGALAQELVEKYARAGAWPLCAPENGGGCGGGVEYIYADVASSGTEQARHDPMKLAREIMRVYRLHSDTKLYGE